MRRQKGEYGYRTYRRKIQIYEVLFGGAMIIIQLLARNFTASEPVKNILTVMAILSVLPTANVAAPMLAAWKIKTPKEEFFHRAEGYSQTGKLLYDLILTSKEAVMPADAVMVHPTGVYLYCTSQKVDVKKGEKYLNDMFTAHRLDPNAKIIKDEKAFFQRLDSLKPAGEYEDDGSVDYAFDLLKQLSM